MKTKPTLKAEARERFPTKVPSGNPLTVQKRYVPTRSQPVNAHKRMAGC